MGNISDKSGKENQTHILCSINISENCAIYEIRWKYGTDRHVTI
jgi:hypothetical protein